MSRIDIIYFDAGSGHRSAAMALANALHEIHGNKVEPRVLDLLDVVAGNWCFRQMVARGIDYFNWLLRREKVWNLKGIINLSLLVHDLLTKKGIRAIGGFWHNDPAPAAVVSMTPMYNAGLARALAEVHPETPWIVVPVDFTEEISRYWFDARKSEDLHYMLATDALRARASQVGIRGSHVRPIAGMPVDPSFHRAPPEGVRGALLRSLELDPGRSTGLVHFGGQGSVLTLEVARALDVDDLPINLVCLCGRSEESRRAVRTLQTRYPKRVFGFADDPPSQYYHAADFIIGKPGTLTITEALVTRTPMIALKAKGMCVVQRGNQEWLEHTGVGVVVQKLGDLAAAVRRVLDQSATFREAIDREQHRGVYDLAETVLHIGRDITARKAGRTPLSDAHPGQ